MKRIAIFLLSVTTAILAFSQNIKTISKQRPLYMDLVGLERCNAKNDRIFIEVFRRKHSKAVNYNTSILALFLDKKESGAARLSGTHTRLPTPYTYKT